MNSLPRDILAKVNVRNEAGIRTFLNNFAFRTANHWTTCNAIYTHQKLNVAAMHLMQPLFLSTPLFFLFTIFPMLENIKKNGLKNTKSQKDNRMTSLNFEYINFDWMEYFVLCNFLMIFCQIIVHFMPFKMMAALTGII